MGDLHLGGIVGHKQVPVIEETVARVLFVCRGGGGGGKGAAKWI